MSSENLLPNELPYEKLSAAGLQNDKEHENTQRDLSGIQHELTTLQSEIHEHVDQTSDILDAEKKLGELDTTTSGKKNPPSPIASTPYSDSNKEKIYAELIEKNKSHAAENVIRYMHETIPTTSFLGKSLKRIITSLHS